MVFKKKNKETIKKAEVEKKDTQVAEETNPESTQVASENYKDMYMRVVADFQNYKRRMEKEKSDWIIQAQADVLKPLLVCIDDIDRAIEACGESEGNEEVKNILSGLELVKKNAQKIFHDLGVEEIDCTKAQFNPDLHEALLEVDSPDHETGEVVEVFTKGYLLKGEYVLRHAKVSVAK